MPPAMGLPSMSSRRRAIWLGVPEAARVWLVPEMGSSERVLRTRAEGGKGDALAGSVEAGVDGGGLAFGERADGERLGGDAGGVGERGSRSLGRDAAAGGVCQATDWPASRQCRSRATRAWTVQVKVAPAASESCGVSAESTGGVPPANCACRLEPLVSEAVTMDHVPSFAVTFMVARPSPVAVTEQTGRPQASVAVPAVTV